MGQQSLFTNRSILFANRVDDGNGCVQIRFCKSHYIHTIIHCAAKCLRGADWLNLRIGSAEKYFFQIIGGDCS